MKKKISWKVALTIIILLTTVLISYIIYVRNDINEYPIRITHISRLTDLEGYSKKYEISRNRRTIYRTENDSTKKKKITLKQIDEIISIINRINKERYPLAGIAELGEFYLCTIDGSEYEISKEDWENLAKYLDNLIK